jgi:lysophospholipase L1-like esterase
MVAASSPGFSRKILFTLLTLLISLVVIEMGLHGIDFLVKGVKKKESKILAQYENQEWAATLARELTKPHIQKEYHQYLSWITRPCQGQYVNMDRRYGRKTWNPPGLADTTPAIFIFGGSAAWGSGARDDYTIPSHLSRLANLNQPRFLVRNCAESAYTFTQGLFYLILKLQEGLRPRYVIFYDGFNDIYGGYQSGKAGTVHNVDSTREKLESKPRQIYGRAVKKWLREHIYLYDKVIHKIYRHFHPEAKYHEAGAKLTDAELQDLARDIVQYYARSQQILDRLAKAYGFDYACFWQPALYTETKVFPEETRTDVRLGDQKFGRLYRLANERLADQAMPHFHNLAQAVSSRPRACYLDLVHMTEEGYGLVAQRMFELVQKDLHKALPAHQSN